MNIMYRALVLLGFGIDGAEPIEIKQAMQWTMQRNDDLAEHLQRDLLRFERNVAGKWAATWRSCQKREDF